MSSQRQLMEVAEQLQREANRPREPTSRTIESLKRYIEEHSNEDCLLMGFTSQKANPYREKSSCSLL